jgi:hypothetical protein
MAVRVTTCDVVCYDSARVSGEDSCLPKCSVSEITSGFWEPYRLQKQPVPPRQTGEAIAVRSTKGEPDAYRTY